ncbi:hypothetical protein OIU78_027598, partial [Salix suchowensis]
MTMPSRSPSPTIPQMLVLFSMSNQFETTSLLSSVIAKLAEQADPGKVFP